MEPALFLGRLLRQEVQVGTLLGYLVAREPGPLGALLGLTSPIEDVRVETRSTLANRLDVVLDGEHGPLAVLELKVAAGEHGGQLARYARAEPGALRVLVDLELAGVPPPAGWVRLGLDDVFGCWASSPDPTTSVIATEIAGHFRTWRQQTNRPLAEVDRAMLPPALRAAAGALETRGYRTWASGTAVGKPSLTAHMRRSTDEDTWWSVDIRCEDPARPWHFRVGIEVDHVDSLRDARHRAHELAMAHEGMLRDLDLPGRLTAELGETVASAVVATNPLKTPARRTARLASWVARIDEANEGAMVIQHPVFHHDWGLRLAGKFELDTRRITRTDLIDLVDATLRSLNASSQEAT